VIKSGGFWKKWPGDPYYKWVYRIFNGHHPGVDFGMGEGGNIYNVFKGIVVRKEFHKGMGNTLGIRNGNIVAIYGHLKAFKIELGKIVEAGKVIATSGNTGKATKPDFPHLHFELREIDKPSLPEMVFEPKFNEPIKQWKCTFSYKVFNKNTTKTLGFLALRYFGSEDNWKLIRKINKSLDDYSRTDTLPDKLEVTIPNFE
jgi:murein DD-endopeptidase MepM/ murein hydrolase activator NlpD